MDVCPLRGLFMKPQFLETLLDMIPIMVGVAGKILEDGRADNEDTFRHDMNPCTYIIGDDVTGCQSGL